jgi:hypothetical protein
MFPNRSPTDVKPGATGCNRGGARTQDLPALLGSGYRITLCGPALKILWGFPPYGFDPRLPALLFQLLAPLLASVSVPARKLSEFCPRFFGQPGFRTPFSLGVGAPHGPWLAAGLGARAGGQTREAPSADAVVTPLLTQAMTRGAQARSCLSRHPSRAIRARVLPGQEEIPAR